MVRIVGLFFSFEIYDISILRGMDLLQIGWKIFGRLSEKIGRHSAGFIFPYHNFQYLQEWSILSKYLDEDLQEFLLRKITSFHQRENHLCDNWFGCHVLHGTYDINCRRTIIMRAYDHQDCIKQNGAPWLRPLNDALQLRHNQQENYRKRTVLIFGSGKIPRFLEKVLGA